MPDMTFRAFAGITFAGTLLVLPLPWALAGLQSGVQSLGVLALVAALSGTGLAFGGGWLARSGQITAGLTGAGAIAAFQAVIFPLPASEWTGTTLMNMVLTWSGRVPWTTGGYQLAAGALSLAGILAFYGMCVRPVPDSPDQNDGWVPHPGRAFLLNLIPFPPGAGYLYAGRPGKFAGNLTLYPLSIIGALIVGTVIAGTMCFMGCPPGISDADMMAMMLAPMVIPVVYLLCTAFRAAHLAAHPPLVESGEAQTLEEEE